MRKLTKGVNQPITSHETMACTRDIIRSSVCNIVSKYLVFIDAVYYCALELGNITILSFIMISKCHDNRYRREIFSIVISGSIILS